MILAVYMGYGPKFDLDDWDTSKGIGGSEIALANVLLELKKEMGDNIRIVVLGWGLSDHTDSHGVEWKSCASGDTDMFFKTNDVDVLMIWRYINIFVDVPYATRAKKILIWVHDVIMHDSFQGHRFEKCGRHLIERVSPKITKVMCQSEWHSSQLKELYPSISNKIYILPNGCDKEILEFEKENTRRVDTDPQKIQKIPRRFIWASHHSRTIENLIFVWPHILSAYPDASLVVCGESTPASEEMLGKLVESTRGSVKILGKLGHLELFKELLAADVWFYPTVFPETYCMLGLEAQLAGCLCISSDAASLKTTISDRGYVITIPKTIGEMSAMVLNFLSAHQRRLTETKLERAVSWARDQGWKERSREWLCHILE
jgi:glycosyltransferase involved in cell wall biosynthesis